MGLINKGNPFLIHFVHRAVSRFLPYRKYVLCEMSHLRYNHVTAYCVTVAVDFNFASLSRFFLSFIVNYRRINVWYLLIIGYMHGSMRTFQASLWKYRAFELRTRNTICVTYNCVSHKY